MKCPDDYGGVIRENERLRTEREEQMERCVDDAFHKYYGLYVALNRIQDALEEWPFILRWLFRRRVKKVKKLVADALSRPKLRFHYSLGEHWMESKTDPATAKR